MFVPRTTGCHAHFVAQSSTRRAREPAMSLAEVAVLDAGPQKPRRSEVMLGSKRILDRVSATLGYRQSPSGAPSSRADIVQSRPSCMPRELLFNNTPFLVRREF